MEPLVVARDVGPHLARAAGRWPACVRRAGLFPLWLARAVEWALLDEFLYRLQGMYWAVPAACTAAGHGDPVGLGIPCSATSRNRGPAAPSPWDDFVGLLPGDAVRKKEPRLRPGASRGCWWPQDFVQDLVQ